MSKEPHISFVIPSEYVSAVKEGTMLTLPLDYAKGLSALLKDVCIDAVVETVVKDCSDVEGLARTLLSHEMRTV